MLKEENDYPHYVHHLGLGLRNAFVVVASVLFLLSIFQHELLWARVAGYLCGMLAYVSEYLHLTKFFRQKIPHDEAFMVYCFAPLYLLMGISYILH